MDKRFFIFVISLSIALFGVNWYFENQHQKELITWNAKQKEKNEARQIALEQELQASTIDVSALPLVQIFKDEQGNVPAGWGFKEGNNVITLNQLGNEIFVGKEKKTLIPLDHFFQAAIYTSKPDEPLKIGDLPDFGQFDVQLLTLDPLQAKPAYYTDGNFHLIEDELATLKGTQIEHGNGIVLYKMNGEWLPAGIYDANTKRVLWLEELSGLKTTLVSLGGKTTSKSKAEEQFYVLENDYQQLVFSNYGGALAEINLPFQTETNKVSVVREIDFDRDMVEHHPQNAHFPAHSYFLPGFQKQPQGKLGGYYPLIRRDLIQNEGYKSIRVPPRFYALNIVSEYPEIAELVYEVTEFTKDRIVFEAKQSYRKITKTFSLADSGPYTVHLTVKVEGDSRGLWLNSGLPEVEWISGSAAPVLKYRITRNQRPDVELIDLPQDATTISSLNPDWIVNSNGFFGLILDPLSEIGSGLRASFVSGSQVPSRLVEIDQQYDLYPADKMPGYQVMLPLKSSPGTMDFRIFAGPFSSSILKQVDAQYSNPETGYNPDYIASQTFHGWFSFISEPFAKLLFWLMQGFHWLTGSWGLSIILLTIALRVMLYPLNAWSFKSTINMQKIAPEVKAIQDKYKKDPQKAQLEIVNLYRERGVNPLSGCLPLLIQMPFLIGMFDLLKSSFELRGASFIPGWINDLSAPDTLFTWGYPIFFIGNAFHLLPFLLGGVMFLQQKMMSPAPSDPSEMTDQQRQQKAMGTMMTLMFTVLFYHFPSGLNIYWLSSMLLGMLQQWWTSKRMTAAKPVTKPK